jgi:hypothetical protein
MAKSAVIHGLDKAAPARYGLPAVFSIRINELYSWAPHMPYPERVTELHDMRIAAKRLRYCFEFFSPCFGKEVKGLLENFKKLQDYLGEIHDCDVWVDTLRAQLREASKETEKARRSLDKHTGASVGLGAEALVLQRAIARGPQPGLLAMIGEICKRRAGLYKDLLAFWAQLERSDFRGQLLAAVARAAGGIRLPRPDDAAEAVRKPRRSSHTPASKPGPVEAKVPEEPQQQS